MADAGADTSHLYDDSKFGDISVKLDVQNRLKTKAINIREEKAFQFRVKIMERALEVSRKEYEHDMKSVRNSLQDIYIKTPYFDAFWKRNTRGSMSNRSSAFWREYSRYPSAPNMGNIVDRVVPTRRKESGVRLIPISRESGKSCPSASETWNDDKTIKSASKQKHVISPGTSRNTSRKSSSKSLKDTSRKNSSKSEKKVTIVTEMLPNNDDEYERESTSLTARIARSKSLPSFTRHDSARSEPEPSEKTRPVTVDTSISTSPNVSPINRKTVTLAVRSPFSSRPHSCDTLPKTDPSSPSILLGDRSLPPTRPSSNESRMSEPISSPPKTVTVLKSDIEDAVLRPKSSSRTLPLLSNQTIRRRRGEVMSLERLTSKKMLKTKRKKPENVNHITEIEEIDPFTLRTSTRNKMRKAKFCANNLDSIYQKRFAKPKETKEEGVQFNELPQNGILRAAFVSQLNKRPTFESENDD